ncbi:MAG: hypothetical protein ISS63_04605 [Desulfobacteraceae bacterium]|nr:hypothetical protein [Desulfobacteraceae bacterium]
MTIENKHKAKKTAGYRAGGFFSKVLIAPAQKVVQPVVGSKSEQDALPLAGGKRAICRWKLNDEAKTQG